MGIRRFFEKLLSVPAEQMKLFSLLALASFLQSLQMVFLDAVSSGVYLGTYGVIDLAFTFVWGGMLLIIAGFWIASLEHQFGAGFIGFLGTAFVVQVLLLWGYENGIKVSVDIAFGIKFAYRLILFAGFWALALRFLTLDLQSKRFLGVVLFDFLGVVTGGLIVWTLLPVWGISFFWFVSVGLLFALMGVCSRLLSFQKQAPEILPKKNGGVREPTQLKLMYLIFGVAFVYAASRCLIEYILCIDVLQIKGLSLDSIAALFGGIWALVGLSCFVGMVILYRLRHAFHIMYGMFMLACLPVVSYLGWAAQMVWVVFFAKVLFEALSYCCVAYYFRMIPRPLSHGHTYRLKIFRLCLFEPVGFIMVGSVFYFFPFAQAAVFLSVILTCVFIALLLDGQTEYAKVLLSAFKTFRWRGGRLIITNPKVIAFITEKTNSQNADEVIYFLRVLEDARFNRFPSFLRKALKHSDERVRCFALSRIEKGGYRMFRKAMADVLDKDDSPLVRQTALRVLCAIKEKYSEEKAILYLDDPDLRKGALIGLLKTGGEGILIASEGLNKLAFSNNPKHRLEAAEILEQTALKGFFRLVLRLMQDENWQVREQALLAAGRIAHPQFLPVIFKSLNSLRLRDKALQALKEFGPKAYPAIEQALMSNERTQMCKRTLVSYLWISEEADAQNVLMSVLQKTPFSLRFDILRHLKVSDVRVGKRKRQRIFIPLIETDFRQAITVLLLIKDLQVAPTHDAEESFGLLRDSLKAEFFKIQKSMLMELEILLDLQLFRQAVDVMLSHDTTPEQKVAAAGMIEDLLPKKLLSVRSIIKEMDFETRLEKLPAAHRMNENNLSDQLTFIMSSWSYRSHWTKACALYCIRKLGDVTLLPSVKEALKDKNPLIRENAVWALGRLIASPKELRKLVLPFKKDENAAVRATAAAVLES